MFYYLDLYIFEDRSIAHIKPKHDETQPTTKCI